MGGRVGRQVFQMNMVGLYPKTQLQARPSLLWRGRRYCSSSFSFSFESRLLLLVLFLLVLLLLLLLLFLLLLLLLCFSGVSSRRFSKLVLFLRDVPEGRRALAVLPPQCRQALARATALDPHVRPPEKMGPAESKAPGRL